MTRNAAVADFTRDLAHLVRAGTPLPAALELLGTQASHPALREHAATMARQVRAGERLSGAVLSRPDLFSRALGQFVALGERTESLPEILDRLADHLEATRRLRSRAFDSILYPLVTFVFCLLVTGFMRVSIFPTFVGSGDPTISTPLFQAAVRLLQAASTGGLFLTVYLLSPWADRMRWNLPLVGILWRQAGVACTCRSLALALQAGSTLPQAVRMAAAAEPNSWLAGRLVEAERRVAQGYRLSEALEAAGCFPANVIQAVAAGEGAEELPKSLRTTANLYEQLLEGGLSTLVLLLEPVALLLVGGFVALACLSFWYPFYSLVQSIQ